MTPIEILDGLEKRGFEVIDAFWPADCFEFMVKKSALDMPQGIVRVLVDDTAINVYVFNGNGIELWKVAVTETAPPSVVLSVVDQAIAYVTITMMGGYLDQE